MKKIVCLLAVLIVVLCGCAQDSSVYETADFKEIENGILVDNKGTEYAYFTYEEEDPYFLLGEPEFLSGVQGEVKTFNHAGGEVSTGVFAIKGDKSRNVLIRYFPDNEFFAIYRKADLAAFDISINNCIRFEWITGTGIYKDIRHATCNQGITDKAERAAFLSEIRSQPDPIEAGLYDIVRGEDGFLKNCYELGEICGFFEEEPLFIISMPVTSYNDLAYSVSIGDEEYVLPDKWVQRLRESNSSPT